MCIVMLMTEGSQDRTAQPKLSTRSRTQLPLAATVARLSSAVREQMLTALHDRVCSWGLNPPVSRSDLAM
jgi:hypothetical protein